MSNRITVSCFSAGVSSAVATKLMIDQIDKIIYQHIDDQHEDTLRFVADCEKWFGKPIEIMRSPIHSVENACRQAAYVNGPRGAACTRLLKRRPRQMWELEHRFFNSFRYVWGLDSAETIRADRLRQNMPEHEHLFPLLDAGITKEDAHGILHRAGINRPQMYDMGYPNNNCVGCVKGGAGYWNKIRRDFPGVFESRSALERLIGRSCLTNMFLDELDPAAGRNCKMILEECGSACEAIVLSQDNIDSEVLPNATR